MRLHARYRSRGATPQRQEDDALFIASATILRRHCHAQVPPFLKRRDARERGMSCCQHASPQAQGAHYTMSCAQRRGGDAGRQYELHLTKQAYRLSLAVDHGHIPPYE